VLWPWPGVSRERKRRDRADGRKSDLHSAGVGGAAWTFCRAALRGAIGRGWCSPDPFFVDHADAVARNAGCSKVPFRESRRKRPRRIAKALPEQGSCGWAERVCFNFYRSGAVTWAHGLRDRCRWRALQPAPVAAPGADDHLAGCGLSRGKLVGRRTADGVRDDRMVVKNVYGTSECPICRRPNRPICFCARKSSGFVRRDRYSEKSLKSARATPPPPIEQ